jgi:hypothetical protein
VVTINREFGLGTDKLYFALELTEKEAKLIENKNPSIYKIDGKSVFELKKNNIPTGKRIMYIMFE